MLDHLKVLYKSIMDTALLPGPPKRKRVNKDTKGAFGKRPFKWLCK